MEQHMSQKKAFVTAAVAKVAEKAVDPRSFDGGNGPGAGWKDNGWLKN